MIEALPIDLLYPVAAIAGTAILSALAGRAWGRRTIAVAYATRAAVDVICDAIEDGTITEEEVRAIVAAGNNWLAAVVQETGK
jgi:hypothetical protein